MQWHDHSTLNGAHSFLSPSGYHWLNYTDEHLVERWTTSTAAARGTELHAFAQQAISLGLKMPKNSVTINNYINDAIGYRMTPEVLLYVSKFAFGTADAIFFDGHTLRIHDLKTGITPASMKQLYIYAAFFCIEYLVDPSTINIELRIYQNNEVVKEQPEAAVIKEVMETILRFDWILSGLEKEG